MATPRSGVVQRAGLSEVVYKPFPNIPSGGINNHQSVPFRHASAVRRPIWLAIIISPRLRLSACTVRHSLNVAIYSELCAVCPTSFHAQPLETQDHLKIHPSYSKKPRAG